MNHLDENSDQNNDFRPQLLLFKRQSKLKSPGSLKNLRKKLSKQSSIAFTNHPCNKQIKTFIEKISSSSIHSTNSFQLSLLKKMQAEINRIKPCFHLIQKDRFDQLFENLDIYFMSQNQQLSLLHIIIQYVKACQFNALKMKNQQWFNNKVKQISGDLLRTTNQIHFQHVRSLKILQQLFCDLSKVRRKSMSIFGNNKKCNLQIFKQRNSNTENIIDTIIKQADNLGKNMKINLNQIQFNIQDRQELLKVSNIVKECTQYQLDTFLFLSDYLQQCVLRMAQSGRSIIQIDKNLKQAINFLKKQHPPNDVIPQGESLNQIPSRKLKWTGDYQRINLSLFTPESRNQQLQNFIMKIAETASKNLQKLIQITKDCCVMNNGISYKTGLKIKSDYQKSSIDRVKQKLLSTNFSIFQITQNMRDLKQFLKKQEKAYHRQLQQIFAQAEQQIVFTVSDMLRGKCMFRQIHQINDAALQIIEKCRQKGYPVKQIDNRLGKGTTDLVLKIEIQGIIAEFQLAYKFNIVKNQFNHKLYQLSRSKFFNVVSNLFRFNQKSFKVMEKYLGRVQKVKKQGKQIRVQLQNQKIQSVQFLSQQLEQYIQWRTDNRQQFVQNKSLLNQTMMIKKSNLRNIMINLKNYVNQLNGFDQIDPDQFMVILRTGIFLKHAESLQKAKDKIKQGLQRIQQKSIYKKQAKNITLYQSNDDLEEGIKISLKTQDKQSKQKNAQKHIMKLKRMLGSINFHLKLDDQALQNYKQILQNEKNLSGQDSIDYAKVLNNLGVVEKGKGNLSTALKYLLQSLRIQKQYIAIQQSKLDIRTSQKALRKIQNNLSLADSLNNLGLIQKSKGDYKAALSYFQQCLEIQLKSKGKESMECAKTLDNIGTVYYQKRDFTSALTYFEDSLQAKKKLKGQDSLECADSLNNIGIVYLQKMQYQMAIKYFEKCLQVKQKIKGKQSIDCVNILNNIGSVYKEKKDLQSALKYFLESFKIQQKIKGVDSIDCAVTLHNIGSVYDAKQQYSKALSYYLKSLKIKQSIKGEKSIDCADTLNNIGIVYSKNFQYEDAQNFFLRAVSIHKQIRGSNTTDYADSLLNLAITYKGMKNFDEALKYLQECLSIQQKMKGSYHQDVANIFNQIAQVYQQKGQVQKALQFYHNALQIQDNLYHQIRDSSETLDHLCKNTVRKSNTKVRKNSGEEKFLSENIRKTLFKIACIYKNAYDLETATTNYRKLQKILKQQLQILLSASQNEEDNLYSIQLKTQLIKTLHILGEILRDQNNFQESFKFYKQAINLSRQLSKFIKEIPQNSKKQLISDQSLKQIDQKQILLLQDLASLFNQQGNYDKALFYYQSSLQKLQLLMKDIQIKEINGEDKKEKESSLKLNLARTFNNMGSIYYKKKDFKSATQYFQKCAYLLKLIKGQKDSEYINVIQNMGLVYYQKGQYSTCIQKLTQSLNLKNQLIGKQSKQYTKTLNTIGTSWIASGNTQKAIQCYKECLQIQCKLQGQNSLDSALIFSNLGSVYNGKKDFKNALICYNACLNIYQKQKGFNSQQYKLIHKYIQSIQTKLQLSEMTK